MLKTDKQKRFKATVLALMLAAMPLVSYAAGLGRLAVSSALGQPLRAEIDLTASREELSSLSARLASSDAFKNAGIEYTPALSAIRFAVERRPNGQTYLLVTSDRPFTEPFVDMLVEVNWASGRLVREYTFLLDPPDILTKPAPVAPVAVPEVKKEAGPAAAAPAKEPAAPAAEPKAPEVPRAAEKPAEKAADKASAGATTREVRKGDTLAKIAVELKPEGVNLDQMLVALFRSNREVFDDSNMNRLRAGKILTIPDKDAAPAIEPGEARRIVVAQAIDFNAYRKRLATLAGAAAPKEEAPKQAVAGKITPRVEEKVPPAAAGDKLEVSRAATTGKEGKPGARISAMEEDLVARNKALRDANSRIAELEKNLADLRRLAEMKSAAGAKRDAVPPAKPAEPPKPAPVLAVPAQPVEPPKPVESAAPAPKPVAPMPVVPPPAPPPPPSFVEANPEIVFGGGAIVALLLGYLGFNIWRRKRQGVALNPVADAEFSSNSVFGATEGQGVDTDVALPTDFSREGMSSATGDEGVDPVAEAEVYMAYGRDKQAEEILLEALKTDPTRVAIHLKLLEIYAARKSVQPFGAVARELHGLTGGTGPDWAKAAALGLVLDPTNPLFGGTEEPAAGEDMAATMIVAAPIVTTPEKDDGAQAVEMAPAVEAPVEEPAEEVPASLDFDLDLGAEPTPAAEATEAAAAPADEVLSLDFDLDLGAAPAAEPSTEPAAAADPDPSAGLDFDLGEAEALPAEPAAEPPAAEVLVAPASAAAEEVAALDFDFDLGHEAPAEVPPPAPEPEMPLDLSSISLELGEPEAEPIAVEAPAAASAVSLPELAVESVVADDPEVATKLELAQAYEEMGDKEGARELLNEVLNEGSPAQRDAARAKLAQLA